MGYGIGWMWNAHDVVYQSSLMSTPISATSAAAAAQAASASCATVIVEYINKILASVPGMKSLLLDRETVSGAWVWGCGCVCMDDMHGCMCVWMDRETVRGGTATQ